MAGGIASQTKRSKRKRIDESADADGKSTLDANTPVALVSMIDGAVLAVYNSKHDGFEAVLPLLPEGTTRTQAISYIRSVVTGRQKSYGGFFWRAATESDRESCLDLDVDELRKRQDNKRSTAVIRRAISLGDSGIPFDQRSVVISSMKDGQILRICSGGQSEAYDVIAPFIPTVSRNQAIRYIRACLFNRQKSFLGLLFRFGVVSDNAAVALHLDTEGLKEHRQIQRSVGRNIPGSSDDDNQQQQQQDGETGGAAGVNGVVGVGDDKKKRRRPTTTSSSSSSGGQNPSGTIEKLDPRAGIALVDLKTGEVLRIFYSKVDAFEALRAILPSRTTRIAATSYMGACVYGRQKSYGGFSWRRASEEDVRSALNLDNEALKNRQAERYQAIAAVSNTEDRSVLKVFRSLRAAVSSMRSIVPDAVNLGTMKRSVLNATSYVGFMWKFVADDVTGVVQDAAPDELLKYRVIDPVGRRFASITDDGDDEFAALEQSGIFDEIPPNSSIECYYMDTEKTVRVFNDYDSILEFVRVHSNDANHPSVIAKVRKSISSRKPAFGVGWRYISRDSPAAVAAAVAAAEAAAAAALVDNGDFRRVAKRPNNNNKMLSDSIIS